MESKQLLLMYKYFSLDNRKTGGGIVLKLFRFRFILSKLFISANHEGKSDKLLSDTSKNFKLGNANIVSGNCVYPCWLILSCTTA